MTRRTAALVSGAIVLLVLAGGAVVFWQSTGAHAPPDDHPTPIASAAATPDIRALVQERLEEHLTACTGDEIAGGIAPEGCGIRIPWGTEFAHADTMRFRIEQMPEVSLDDDGFHADGGILTATITGTGQDGAPRVETYRTSSWSLSGEVLPIGDDVEITVR